MKLDRSKAFGIITPPLLEDDFDRPACFEQNAKLYDAHDRLIEPGKPLAADLLDTEDDGGAADVPGIMPASQLLADADVMPWARFKAQAKIILGETCPSDKNSIKAALSEAVAKVRQRQMKRNTPGVGLTWDGVTGKDQAKAGDINLAAWARGQTEYLFAEVQKALRATYAKQVTERRDAVDFLIEQGVIAANEARTDV